MSKRSRAVSGFDGVVTGKTWCAREAVTDEVGVQGKRSRAKLGFRVQGSGFRIQGSGFRVQGSGYRVQDTGLRVKTLSPRANFPERCAGPPITCAFGFEVWVWGMVMDPSP